MVNDFHAKCSSLFLELKNGYSINSLDLRGFLFVIEFFNIRFFNFIFTHNYSSNFWHIVKRDNTIALFLIDEKLLSYNFSISSTLRPVLFEISRILSPSSFMFLAV